MGNGFVCRDRTCIGWHQRRVVREFSVLCPLVVYSSLRYVRSCGGYHGLGSRLGLLGLLRVRFLLLGFTKKMRLQR